MSAASGLDGGLCPNRDTLYRPGMDEEEAVIPRPPVFRYMKETPSVPSLQAEEEGDAASHNALSAGRRQGRGRRDGDTPGVRLARDSGRTERSSWTLPSRPLLLCLSTFTTRVTRWCAAHRA